MQGLEGVAADPEPGQAVAVAAQELQAGEGPEVELLQPGVPHVQLGDVGQRPRLPHHHALQPVQPGAPPNTRDRALVIPGGIHVVDVIT